MKLEILTHTDLYINDVYYTTLDRVILCSNDEMPEQVKNTDKRKKAGSILCIYKKEIPKGIVPEKGVKDIGDFFRKALNDRQKIFKNKILNNEK